MKLETVIPDFKARTTKGIFNFYKWLGDSWCVLFSHPEDFAPACTSELGRFAVHYQEFVKRNVKLLVLACDELDDHREWIDDIKTYYKDIAGDFPYPIITDDRRELAVKLGIIDAESRDNEDVAMTVRALYIISPDHKLKLSMVYPVSTGKNIDEILRVIDSLQLTSKVKMVVTPANWTPGSEVMILPQVKDEDLPKLFPKGVEKVEMPSGVHVRTTTDY